VDGCNIYRYARNAVSSLVDPNGLDSGQLQDQLRRLNNHGATTGNMVTQQYANDAAAATGRLNDMMEKQEAQEAAESNQNESNTTNNGTQPEAPPAEPPVTALAGSGEGAPMCVASLSPDGAGGDVTPVPEGTESSSSNDSDAEAAGGSGGGGGKSEPASLAKVDTTLMNDATGATKLVKELLDSTNPVGIASVKNVVSLSNSRTKNGTEVEAYLANKDGNVQLIGATPSGNPLSSPFRDLNDVAKGCNCTVYSQVHTHDIDNDTPGSGRNVPSGQDRDGLITEHAPGGLFIAPGGIYWYGQAPGSEARVAGSQGL
jgi:hypothetical protein